MRVKQAYDTLADAGARAQYDLALNKQVAALEGERARGRWVGLGWVGFCRIVS